MTETAQDTTREALVWVTGWIRNETVSGFVFGVLLIATDHFFNLTRGFK